MAVTPNSLVTPQTPFSRVAATSTANTNFTAPTTSTLLDRADNANGARITRLIARPRAVVGTASHLQIYAYDGSTKVLIDSLLMPTSSAPSGSVAAPATDFGYSEDNALLLRGGWGLEVAPGQAVDTVFRCEGGFY